MPELRLNLVTREWTIIATERAKRPEDFKKAVVKKEIPSFVETCPFCPGNEAKTPLETFSIKDKNGWRIRVTPNKFPALSCEGKRERINNGLKRLVTGVGIHEVIVETPLHNTTTALLPHQDVVDIIKTYKNRFLEGYKDPRIDHIIIFKNHGEGAGTSLEHPHSQLISSPVIPIQIRDRLEAAVHFFDDTGKCLLCMTMEMEKKEGTRIVLETDHFITFIPYAALSPFHTWVFPKRHAASFGDITEEETKDLALNLKTTLAKLYYGLDNPDYNYCIRSSRPRDADSEYFHWYLSITPRLSKAAGFELGSGMFINASLPEESARFLREAKCPS